ncbi:uncharacterized protein DDB_G0286299-like [Cydia pomonella]|uniref:uncharacterized protein DDB_G0286299-like n=1 Tax=Cydia pomonella TaxID=82600 RepID=UPI002ADDAF02|nr:uncharacterized protein DDB_G0286299-like [Cydia pomonella]
MFIIHYTTQKHEKQINSFNAETVKPYKTDIDEEDSEEELYATTNVKGNEQTLPQLLVLPSDSKVGEFDEEMPQIFSSALSLVPEERQRLLEMYIHELLHDLLKNIGTPVLRSNAITPPNSSTVNTKKKMHMDTDDENAKMFAKEFTQKLHEKLTQEFNEFDRQIKFHLENISSKDDIISEVSDDIKNHNDITDKHEDKIIENEKSENETKENSKDDKELSIKRSYVRFNVEPESNRLTAETIAKLEKEEEKKNEEDEQNKSVNRRLGEQLLNFNDSNDDNRADQKNEIPNKDQKKDEQNEFKDKDEPRRSSDDDDDDDRSASTNKSTSKDPKQGERK